MMPSSQSGGFEYSGGPKDRTRAHGKTDPRVARGRCEPRSGYASGQEPPCGSLGYARQNAHRPFLVKVARGCSGIADHLLDVFRLWPRCVSAFFGEPVGFVAPTVVAVVEGVEGDGFGTARAVGHEEGLDGVTRQRRLRALIVASLGGGRRGVNLVLGHCAGGSC